MVKDRLNELKEKTRDFTNSSKSRDTSIEVEHNPLKNVFNLAEKISEEIQGIHDNTEQCRSFMKQISESPFREKELSDKLTGLFQSNGKLTQNINSYLKQFESHVKNIDKNCTVGRIELIQFNTLRIRFRDCLRQNNDEMEVFRNFRLNTYKAQLKAKGMQMTDDQVTDLLNGDHEFKIFTDDHLMEAAEARRLLCEAEELNEQLLKIENLIRDVRDLFIQMSVLVDEQQELIDVIEYQTQKAQDFVVKVPLILKDAKGKKRRALKMKFLCCGIVTITLVVIAVSLLYT